MNAVKFAVDGVNPACPQPPIMWEQDVGVVGIVDVERNMGGVIRLTGRDACTLCPAKLDQTYRWKSGRGSGQAAS